MKRSATERLEQLADSLGLTGRQRRLGIIVATDPDKPKMHAAREAGYSAASSHVLQNEALKVPKVRTFISAARREITGNRRGRIADAQEILEFHSTVMRGNMADFLTKDEQTGRVRVDPSKVSRRKSRLIKEITVKPDGEIKLKLQDAQHSADRLARHFGLYSDDDGSRQLQAALTLGALVGGMPDDERSELARRLMGPAIDVTSVTEVVQTDDVTPKDPNT